MTKYLAPTVLAFAGLFSLSATALTMPSQLQVLPANHQALQNDLSRILEVAKIRSDSIRFVLSEAKTNTATVSCTSDSIELAVSAEMSEQSATFYKALRELGFLFPHPRRQVTPSDKNMRRQCGQTIQWRPTMRVRGMHLHTLHPSEWTHGFFMNKPEVAQDTVRWLARNGQNALDLILLRLPLGIIAREVGPAFKLAQDLQIHTGISIGIATQQQRTYRLLNLWESSTGRQAERRIAEGLNDLIRELPLSFITLEVGTSEFTATDFDRTLKWFNLATETCAQENVALFTKVHVSSNQHHDEYGNFNFLAQFADPRLGIWPHTVMFYGLLDEKAPMYGNDNFHHIRGFLEQQKTKRPTWYYPETSYWIGMDADVPLLLTEYLRTRAEDYRFLAEQGVEGHMNFTTGHALGGWLWDWNLALMTDRDYDFDPLAGLRLLGEDTQLWQEHLSFQQAWFKEKGLIAMLSAANLQDELSTHRIHDRFIMKELHANPERLAEEVALLETGLVAWPSLEGIKDKELREMLTITQLRHRHALEIRRALQVNKELHISKARALRLEAQERIEALAKLATNYPELPLFKRHANPTSYQFGYVYLAASTYFWEREERQVATEDFWPFRGNIINLIDLFF